MEALATMPCRSSSRVRPARPRQKTRQSATTTQPLRARISSAPRECGGHSSATAGVRDCGHGLFIRDGFEGHGAGEGDLGRADRAGIGEGEDARAVARDEGGCEFRVEVTRGRRRLRSRCVERRRGTAARAPSSTGVGRGSSMCRALRAATQSGNSARPKMRERCTFLTSR